MIPLIEKKRDAIVNLCRKYHVSRLEVLGSAADDSFDAERSDVDFLVAFSPGTDLGPWLSHYFDLKGELAQLFGCKVDLVMPTAMRNPYFIREVNRTRKVVYAA